MSCIVITLTFATGVLSIKLCSETLKLIDGSDVSDTALCVICFFLCDLGGGGGAFCHSVHNINYYEHCMHDLIII